MEKGMVCLRTGLDIWKNFSLHPKGTVLSRLADMMRMQWLLVKPPKSLDAKKSGKPSVVISLASYPRRFPTLPLVLRSLLRQSTPPDIILVWLDCHTDELPPALQKFSRHGVQFRFVSPGLGSHKKWYFTLQEFGDSIVITVDDDIAYPFRTVEKLIAAHRIFPEAVCALRCHRIVKTPQGRTAPYGIWHKGSKENIIGPSHELLATGCWGILYPPHVFAGNPYAFDWDLIGRLAPRADDIWLKFMELVSDRKVYLERSRFQMYEIPGTQTQALALENCFADDSGLTGNDRAVAELQRRFNKNKRCAAIFPQ